MDPRHGRAPLAGEDKSEIDAAAERQLIGPGPAAEVATPQEGGGQAKRPLEKKRVAGSPAAKPTRGKEPRLHATGSGECAGKIGAAGKVAVPQAPQIKPHIRSYGRAAPASFLKPDNMPWYHPQDAPDTSDGQKPLFTLVGMDSLDLTNDIPTGVRLDDYTCGRLLLAGTAPKTLHAQWPDEFDQAGMLRALRKPLGHAYKIEVEEGMRDAEGRQAKLEDEGYYYGWYKGLQPLIGHEGRRNGLYQIRKSHEEILCKKINWFPTAKCIVQLPAGHPLDDTMATWWTDDQERNATSKKGDKGKGGGGGGNEIKGLGVVGGSRDPQERLEEFLTDKTLRPILLRLGRAEIRQRMTGL